MENKFAAYKSFRDSIIGQDLIRWIEEEYARCIDEASKETSPDAAFTLLKKAHGIITVKEHIDIMANHK